VAVLVSTLATSTLTAGVAAAKHSPPVTTTTTSPTTPGSTPTTLPTTDPAATTTTTVAPTTTTTTTAPKDNGTKTGQTTPKKSSYDPAVDVNSLPRTASYMGASVFWDAGFTGRGVDVAIIDSGVAPVPGLDGPDKIIHGPDLSFESQVPELHNLDTFGHGTFMAGLIAGRDADLSTPYSSAPASQYRGIAPDARIVSLKVATADGGVDVSQVIAAIDWVVQHKNDNGMNIRVLNLSYSINSAQSYLVDPLAFAVEQAWNAGIFVVASSGNAGYIKKDKGSGNIGMPARDPFVLAVGASDSRRTPDIADDIVPEFSSSGGKDRYPDLVAPGTSLQGLRVPGSYLDLVHPEGQIDDRYFRGSGTSQSAAVVSGAAALVIQQRPEITPGQLKELLEKSLHKLGDSKKEQSGKGQLVLSKVFTGKSDKSAKTGTPGTGIGSLDLARGTDRVSDDGVPIVGEIDIFGHSFDSAAMAALEAARASWADGTWNGNVWTGRSWTGRSWTGAAWTGRSWTGRSWTGRSWTGRSWTGRSWTGGAWAGSSLSGRSWSGDVWATGYWG